MTESIRIYHEHLPVLTQDLVANGSLALILMDVSPFGTIEEEYGTPTYNLVRQRIFDLLIEQAGKDYRKEDILTLDEPGGQRVLLFLSPRRQVSSSTYGGLEALRLRLMRTLIPNLWRTAFPYLKKMPQIDIGSSIGIHNPLLDPHHVLTRIIREALDRARWQHSTDEMESLQRVREVILNEQVVTLYQPIVEIHDQKPMGYEALSRGIAGGPFQSADELFDSAIKHHLLVELDRICRKRSLLFCNRLPAGVKLFVNTLPATIRDPEFHGQHLIRLLEQAQITPDRIVIEITEKLVIENLGMFQHAITYFTALGMSLAVDDVGSGYSGLETVSKLKPSYLKLDASLIRGIHTSAVNQEMLKAIMSLGRGIGAKVIAEGIEKPEELSVLRDLGADYGQGYYFGKPDMMFPQSATS
jgi:EAL domain-containing protein (putative c-di-GMP-specific phosphodiesterase class I)